MADTDLQNEDRRQVCFIGLGVMGAPMAGHLATAGLQVAVYNRSRGKAEAWLRAHPGHSIVELRDARKMSTIISCVGNDQDLSDIYLGDEGLLAHLPAGALVIDHTTASADIARQLNSAAEARGIGFIDAPVSGGQQGAINGALTVMCGGQEPHFRQAQAIIEHYAKMARLLGPAGSGQLTKMANQIAIAGLIESLAESIHFATVAGLDEHAVIEVISKGAAQSWQMENRHDSMIRGDYEHGFAVDLMRKDLAICLDEARRNGAHLPVAALVDQFYGEVQQLGGGRWDTSSLLSRFSSRKD
ncbi:NAD(P)-dependent oxidoreductase [Allohahella marinimesophila]|uniref:NAD(P)-dependent oxidoreductase n=1 Tax=Allohahella marinimesophila TaxID=1054972 RepID=A0ABP7QB01_9GAMM